MRDLVPWIRLTKAGVRPLRLHALLQSLGSPQAIFASSTTQIMAASGMAATTAERLLAQAGDACNTDLAAMERLGVELLTWDDARYPPLLREIADPPCALYLRGTLETRDRTAVAVVGTRYPSAYGRQVAETLSRKLAEAGITIVSGLARGIDTRAHRGALEGGGRTACVLGSALDRIYPAENARLAEEIASHGAVLSEYPMGTGPDGWHFPARNRIVSGLSLGTVVVEGEESERTRSGALITADFALEQGREVFAVPGEIRNPLTTGPHHLIQEGAKLVTSVDDILSELGLLAPRAPATTQLALPELNLSAEEARVLDSLGPQPQQIEEVIAECGLTAAQVSASLLMLELKGLAAKMPGNSFVRRYRGGRG
jgi:DNA processing protein